VLEIVLTLCWRRSSSIMGATPCISQEQSGVLQVLDTPEFFWSAPDSMQNLYKRVCEYMELDNRVEVLNNRLMVRPAASARQT
jgi:Uncharacterised ACR, YagE family COG1723